MHGYPLTSRSRILLYFRTGHMSAIAAAGLVARGYTSVADLRGGMVAWEATGRSVATRR